MAKIFNFKHENKCHLVSCYFQIKHLKFKFHLLPTIYKKNLLKKKLIFAYLSPQTISTSISVFFLAEFLPS